MAPRSLLLAALVVGRVLATADTAAQGTVERSNEKMASGYQGALQSAQSAVNRIQELQQAVQKGEQPSLESAEASAEKEVEASLGVSRQHLQENFAQLQEKAAAAAHRAKQGSAGGLEEANEALRGMEQADTQLLNLDHRVQDVLEDRSRTLEDASRRQARQAEEQADRLARAARTQTDRLDRAARKFEMPDTSDRLGRQAESAARKVQDEAQKVAREAEDASRELPKDFKRRQRDAARARRRALDSTRDLIESASQEPSATPAMLVSRSASRASGESADIAAAGIATFAGAAAVALVAFARQRQRQDEDELDNKYLLVV